MKSGVLNLYKEKGYTSHDAVAKVRGLFGTRKVGHTGTLDPEAEGVLPILIGSAAKACDLIPSERKVYRASLRFGLETDTEDVWGSVLKENDLRPTREAVEEAAKSFLGEYMQIPPMISAVKISGKKLYEYARAGIYVERSPRPVFVHSFTLLSFTPEEATFRAEVSKGTYIRTLLTDLCKKVGVLGAMSALLREESGMFSLENTVTLSDLQAMTREERDACLLPTEALFEEYETFDLPPFFDRLIANGCAVSTSKLGLSQWKEGTSFRLRKDGAFFALGKIISEEGETKLFKIKNFPPDVEG